MVSLHETLNFHYEAMRALGTIPYHGADLNEVFEIMPKIKADDFDSWYDEWYALAQRVLSTVDESKAETYSTVTFRNTFFRASHYIFVADFFLHGNRKDPRITPAFKLWRTYFDKANALLPIPGVHLTIQADGFEMPAMVFRAAEASTSNPRPALIVGGGFESNMEETWHVFGVEALARGYNVIIYEGPGHRTLIETQDKGFIAEWEKAVSPIVDYILAHKDDDLSFVDTSKLGLIGMSLGGYLAARAAAFEPRLAAVMCIDGVMDFFETLINAFPQCKDAWVKGDKAEFDRLFEADEQTWNTNRRWIHDDLHFTFCKDSAFEIFQVAEKMSLEGVAQQIKMPAFIADASDDMFFEGQPRRVAEAIGDNATLEMFTAEQGAQLHCQSGALVYMNQRLFDWFASVVGH